MSIRRVRVGSLKQGAEILLGEIRSILFKLPARRCQRWRKPGAPTSGSSSERPKKGIRRMKWLGASVFMSWTFLTVGCAMESVVDDDLFASSNANLNEDPISCSEVPGKEPRDPALVCDYRPKSVFTVGQGYNCRIGIIVVSLNSQSSDQNGQIVRHEWFVDGTKLASEAPSVLFSEGVTVTRTITLRVTDNTGNTAQSSKSVRLVEGSNRCGGQL